MKFRTRGPEKRSFEGTRRVPVGAPLRWDRPKGSPPRLASTGNPNGASSKLASVGHLDRNRPGPQGSAGTGPEPSRGSDALARNRSPSDRLLPQPRAWQSKPGQWGLAARSAPISVSGVGTAERLAAAETLPQCGPVTMRPSPRTAGAPGARRGRCEPAGCRASLPRRFCHGPSPRCGPRCGRWRGGGR